jgi:prepilin-type processing-associated H-X9-DG protein
VGTAEQVSYGVNSCVHRLQNESFKVVMLDAHSKVIEYENIGAEKWLASVAPRHFGTMNVLYFDGRVERQGPTDLNPFHPLRGEQIRFSTWQPRLGGCDECNDPEKGGLKGLYYSRDSSPNMWERSPVMRIDNTLEMPFGCVGGGYYTPDGAWNPSPYLGPTEVDPRKLESGSWSGYIRVFETGDYTFWGACDNYVAVYLNAIW